MNVSLSPHFDKLIAEKVKSGSYNSASEVIREALRLLEQKDAQEKAYTAYMKKEIEKGMKGPFKEWDAKSFLEKAHKKFGLEETVK